MITSIVRVNPATGKPDAINASRQPEKINRSRNRRSHPGIGTAAFPDLLGSSGTANVPQIVAAPTTRTTAHINLAIPSCCVHAQNP